jgi:hypothetical protein
MPMRKCHLIMAAMRPLRDQFRGGRTDFPRSLLRPAVALVTAAGILAGCASGALVHARAEIAAGHYGAAHQELAQAAGNQANLSQRERRELNDGLCLTEYKIGAPSYPLGEQQQACAAATALNGSRSGPLLAAVELNRRDAISGQITSAIAQGDIAEAENQIRDYQSVPGGDSAALNNWSREVWALVRQHDRSYAKSRASRIAPAISAVARQYPKIKGMNDRRFRQWIEENTTVSGTPLVSQVEIGRQTVNLWLAEDRRHAAALNLDRFARINDALIARCHCDGRTNVALQDGGLPAYLVRLDPEIRQSEIIILSNP